MINFKVDNMGRWNMDNMLYITVPIVAHKAEKTVLDYNRSTLSFLNSTAK